MKIDLARKHGMGMEMPVSPQTPSYPRLHIDCGDALLNGLPDSGTMEIKFKVVSRSCNEDNGKKSCCVTLEVQKILEVEAPEPDDAREALDKLAKLESASENTEEDED